MLLREDRALFVDARPSTEYEASGVRVPGALPVGAGTGVDILEMLKSLPDDRVIVIYCDEPDQAASALIAHRARELGLCEGYYVLGGFRAWCQRKLPLEPAPDLACSPEAQPGG